MLMLKKALKKTLFRKRLRIRNMLSPPQRAQRPERAQQSSLDIAERISHRQLQAFAQRTADQRVQDHSSDSQNLSNSSTKEDRAPVRLVQATPF